MLFDPNILKLHRDYASKHMHKSDFLFEFAAQDILDHIETLKQNFNSVIEIDGRTEHLSRLLKMNITKGSDISEFAGKFDLVLSSMNLHWINDVRGFIKQLQNILAPKGTFIANFIGDGSFRNLKRLLIDVETKAGRPHAMHVIPMISAENAYRLFQEAGFDFIVSDIHKIELEYDSPIGLMKELKNMGENNALSSGIHPLPREILKCQNKFEDQIIMVSVVASYTHDFSQ